MAFLIVRPKGKAERTQGCFAQAGLNAVALPLVDTFIFDTPNLPALLNTFSPDLLIVTSTYASNWLCEQALTFNKNHLNILCIGEATATYIQRHSNLPEAQTASPANSEGLLLHTLVDNVANKNIAILKGEGGRNLIETHLSQKQAKVLSLDVYRRILNPNCSINNVFDSTQIQCIIVTSIELLMHTLTQIEGNNVHKLPWIVASERIKDYANEQGINNVIVSNGASDQALLESALKIQARLLKGSL